MASRSKTTPIATLNEFRSLSGRYSHFRWYSVAVLDHPTEVLFTLPPTMWRDAWKRALLFSVIGAVVLGGTWLGDPRPLNPAGVLLTGCIICLWPLYLPLLRRWLLRKRLPWIRFDKERGEVHLLGGSRTVPISEVLAICDVIVREYDNDGASTLRYELQVILKNRSGKEFLLLSGAWHASAVEVLGPVSRKIACLLGVPHIYASPHYGTIVEQKFERSSNEGSHPVDSGSEAERG